MNFARVVWGYHSLDWKTTCMWHKAKSFVDLSCVPGSYYDIYDLYRLQDVLSYVHVTYWHIIAVSHFVCSLVYFVYIIVTSFLFFTTILYISLTLFISTCITVVFAVSGWMLNSILLYWYCVQWQRAKTISQWIDS